MLFQTGHMLFRPPAEADSLILRIADGCPWNRCTFCGMYKDVKYRFHGLDATLKSIQMASRSNAHARRIFLADGDVMFLDFSTLEQILAALNEAFPRLARVSVYANGFSILQKSATELKTLKALKLHTLYMGLESGDNKTLNAAHKRESAEDMIEACQRAQLAGLRMSVMVLLGLAEETGSLYHAQSTAAALNAMQPRLLSALRIVTTPNTPLYTNGFKMISEYDVVNELRVLIQGLDLQQTVFRANHSSNVFPIEARFPKDKGRLLSQLDALLQSGRLDTSSPGRLPLSL